MDDRGIPLVALLGAPRSGTSWLQSLIADDDRVVSPQETSLFSRYVAPLDEAWHAARRSSNEEWARRRFTGLAAVLTEEEFVAAVREFVAVALNGALCLEPGATVVLEKTPAHSLSAPLLAKYSPGPVRFLHIVRDGRDVTASLVAASSGWGAAWAPRTVPTAASMWAEYVGAAMRAREHGPYHEVRYEDLRSDGAAETLGQVLEFCGVPVPREAVAARLERSAFDRQRTGRRTNIALGGEAAKVATDIVEPPGFFRSGSVGGWQEWDTRDRVAFDIAAGEELRRRGYEHTDAWLGPAREVDRERRRARRRRQIARILRAGSSRLRQAADSIDPRRGSAVQSR